MKTIYTAIFGEYEKLKEPLVVTPGWRYVCFTDQPLKSDVWEIRHCEVTTDPRRQARIVKAIYFILFDTEDSIWIDGSFQVNCDLTIYWQRYYKLSFSAPKHPQRKCVYEEVKQVFRNDRGGSEKLIQQIESYRGVVPEHNGLITSGILLRRKTIECINLCVAWWTETEQWSMRDQVSFARVSMGREFHTFEYRYHLDKDFLYIQHKKSK